MAQHHPFFTRGRKNMCPLPTQQHLLPEESTDSRWKEQKINPYDLCNQHSKQVFTSDRSRRCQECLDTQRQALTPTISPGATGEFPPSHRRRRSWLGGASPH